MMSNDKRNRNLEKAQEVLQESGYIYDLSKGGVNAIEHAPPPSGTRMNCQSAARVFMQIAIDMGMKRESLEPLFYEAGEYGYFVPARAGLLALGCPPEIMAAPFMAAPVAPGIYATGAAVQAVQGWEFENHWRVRDMQTGVIYDPTFCTSGNDNPVGIRGTSMTVSGLDMTTVYGEKYRIARINGRVQCEDISRTGPDLTYLVNNIHFKPATLGSLRLPMDRAVSPA